ncbi:hypothetical protein BGZ76_006262 [Entomortierella beljakovae]|nr:hypothetical protein BGZ76_006262 [Entomortierella beljakovae]
MFDFLIDIVPREEYKVTKEAKAAAAAANGGEPRRSQESFPPIGSVGAPGSVPNTAVGPGGLEQGGYEGYGYPYPVLENGSFAVNHGESMDAYNQQQQQQQLQLQYMRAQMAQQGHNHPPSQRYDFQSQQSQ